MKKMPTGIQQRRRKPSLYMREREAMAREDGGGGGMAMLSRCGTVWRSRGDREMGRGRWAHGTLTLLHPPLVRSLDRCLRHKTSSSPSVYTHPSSCHPPSTTSCNGTPPHRAQPHPPHRLGQADLRGKPERRNPDVSQLTRVSLEPQPRCRRGGSTRAQGPQREREDDAVEVYGRVGVVPRGGDTLARKVSSPGSAGVLLRD